MECHIRCFDCNEPISNFQVPRGRGGVAILWPIERDKYIKKLTDGNERIIAAEIQTKNKPICLINVYLPTKMANSDNQYQENLDILQTMIDKYVDSHTIIICGDMNGSLSIERNNSHDAKLKSFMKLNEFHLHTDVRNQSTFYHHDGKSKSQIDYIIANDDVIESITFFDQDHLNSSTHIPVKAKLSSKMATMKTKTRTSCTAYKLLWDKTDRQEYENTFNCILTQNMDKSEEYTIDKKLDYLTRVMRETAEQIVPKRLIRLDGFKWKASPKVRELIGTSKYKHRLWDQAGRPRDGHNLFLDKKEAKKALRKQQRKERSIERELFMKKLESKPDQKTFFQLIRRNHAEVKSKIPDCIKKGEKTANTPEEQRDLFAEYFKELATPKDAPNFNNQHLKESERRFKLINEISKSEEKKKIIVTIEEVEKAIQKLNSGKAADEYGITAEHVKFAGSKIYTLYQDIFNQIFQEGRVAQSFKTGVITPILKKSKDQMLTENYRGITITSVHGKVFEYILLKKTTIAKDGQSNMQFGFTEGLSPNMAALILSEVCSNITAKDILFITTLDSQKAFGLPPDTYG